jgi:hypothetical protein
MPYTTFYTFDKLTRAKSVFWDASDHAGHHHDHRLQRQGTEKTEGTALIMLANAKAMPKFAVCPDQL